MDNKKISVTAEELVSEVLETNIVRVAEKYGVSRQRVSQIFRRNYPDKDYLSRRKESINKKKRMLTIERKEKERESVVFVCRGCGHEVKKKERGSTSLHVFCPACRNTPSKRNRNHPVTSICDFCGGSFHPWYSQANKRKFCCKEHYIKMLKEKGAAWFRK